MKLPHAPPPFLRVLGDPGTPGHSARLLDLLARGIGPAPEGRYRHWDTLRHVTPPAGFTSELWWTAIKLARLQMRRPMPLRDTTGGAFHYTLPDPLLERLHRVDRDGSGRIALPEAVTSPETRDRYLISSLMEEAISSSLLEGAATTRAVAKDLLRTGRDPRTKGERMIVNNFRAMQRLREWKDQPLTPALVQEIHRVLTEGTLEDEAHVFRAPGDGIAVYANDDRGTLLHAPPHASEIAARLEALCDFANGAETGIFLHPAVKAILLHFWLAYDHPFVDGNGRTARALFYWQMLRSGFWLFEFVSISARLHQAPARYARSFLYTETDDNDLTYFLLAQLRVLEQALDALQAYLARKTQHLRAASRLLRGETLNHRQRALLAHALTHPGFAYSIASHRTSHGVVYQTARTDLLDLEARGLLDRRQVRKTYVFLAPDDLAARLASKT